MTRETQTADAHIDATGHRREEAIGTGTHTCQAVHPTRDRLEAKSLAEILGEMTTVPTQHAVAASWIILYNIRNDCGNLLGWQCCAPQFQSLTESVVLVSLGPDALHALRQDIDDTPNTEETPSGDTKSMLEFSKQLILSVTMKNNSRRRNCWESYQRRRTQFTSFNLSHSYCSSIPTFITSKHCHHLET